jgi:hypothetical protein
LGELLAIVDQLNQHKCDWQQCSCLNEDLYGSTHNVPPASKMIIIHLLGLVPAGYLAAPDSGPEGLLHHPMAGRCVDRPPRSMPGPRRCRSAMSATSYRETIIPTEVFDPRLDLP